MNHFITRTQADVTFRDPITNAETGKVAARYDVTKWLAARATISNGFQAPTLAQEHYSALNVSPTDASGILAVNSPGARLLGAGPLKPERSTNVSAGIVLQPADRLTVTADVYQINLRDRIVAAGDVTGNPAVAAIAADGVTLPANADAAETSAYYFANGLSTRTQGVDITAAYLSRFDSWGTVNWSLGIDLNRTRLTHMGTTGAGQDYLTISGVSNYTTAYPRSKIIASALWRIQKWDINIRETRWGSSSEDVEYYDLAPAAISFNGNVTTQFTNTPVWTTDLEIGYQLAPKWHLAVGGVNIFDMQPRRENPLNSYLDVEVFTAGTAGLPEGGGFYYGRVGYTF